MSVCARGAAGVLAMALSSCGGGSAPAPHAEALGGDVARVGDMAIPALLVTQVAEARGATPREAVDDLIEDALAARGARAEGMDRAPGVSWASTAALARTAAMRFEVEAERAGPPTDEELATVTVVHALVRRSPSVAPTRALELARGVASAVASAKDASDFESRARSVPGVANWLLVQTVPGFDIGGDSDDGEHFDPTFVAAAFALNHPGETSGVVETPFGWHVLRLVSREVPPAPVLAERRSRLAAAVVGTRARALVEASIAQRLRTELIDVSPAAEALMSLTQPPLAAR